MMPAPLPPQPDDRPYDFRLLGISAVRPGKSDHQFFKLDTEISGTAVSYLKIVATGFPFIFLAAACTGIYNAAGLSKIPFYVSGSGLIMNMVLDPLFIFGFGMGTNGAACATWLSEATVLAIFIYYLKKKKRLFGGFPFLIRLKSRYSRRIFQLGLPVALLNSLFAVIN